MKKFVTYPILLALITCLFTTPLFAQPVRDGKLFDQGRQMDQKSPLADDELDKMRHILGQWDVVVTTYPTDSTTFSAKGMAEFSYMNRGYAYMGRIHIPAIDDKGIEANMMQFLTYNPANERWVLGEASSYTESISMYDGNLEQRQLNLTTSIRRNGGVLLTRYLVSYSYVDKNTFEITTSTSTDSGAGWTQQIKQVFSRRESSPDFMKTRQDAGVPSPDRPAESVQFDFLLGEWDATHKINLNSQWVQFPVHATAVYTLNGHAILEYSWYDLDAGLPDAATSILRLYNRAMRRWESLYLANRGNSPLFFGGQKEGDTLVLHTFEANTTNAIIPRYVFHDIKSDTYAWYGENSVDRGKTFDKTWIITFSRK